MMQLLTLIMSLLFSSPSNLLACLVNSISKMYLPTTLHLHHHSHSHHCVSWLPVASPPQPPPTSTGFTSSSLAFFQSILHMVVTLMSIVKVEIRSHCCPLKTVIAFHCQNKTLMVASKTQPILEISHITLPPCSHPSTHGLLSVPVCREASQKSMGSSRPYTKQAVIYKIC